MTEEGATALLQRGKWAVVALAASGVAALLGVFMTLRESSKITSALGSAVPDPGSIITADDARLQVGRLQLVLLIVTAALFIMWFRRAEMNIRYWNARGLPFDERWNVAGWLIPVVNLVVPIRMTAVVWKATDPSVSPEIGEEWKQKSLSPLVPLWWAALIGGLVLSRIASGSIGRAVDLEALRSALNLALAANVLLCAAALMGALLVRAITTRQMTRAAFYRVSIPDPPVASAV